MGLDRVEALGRADRQQTFSSLDTVGDSSALPGSDPATAKQHGLPDEPQLQAWPWEANQEKRYPSINPDDYTDFDKRYPPDRFGEESTSTSRGWKIYRDRAQESNDDLLDGWNKTLDILLIFAGLFSAVSTAFIIESYKNLQPDYTEYMAKALYASLAAQTPGNSTRPELEDPEDFTPPSAARWVNGLWFTSLSLSLFVALLAILAKQWVEDYSSRMRSPTASTRWWVWRHVTYSRGLARWGLGSFISALPFLLHVSLFLFFAGLSLFLVELDATIAYLTLGSTAGMLLFYAVVTFLPIWYADCPSATPMIRQVYRAVSSTRAWAHTEAAALISRYPASSLWPRLAKWLKPPKVPAFNELELISGHGNDLNSSALTWMVTTLPSQNEVTASVHVIGSLDDPSEFPLLVQDEQVRKKAAIEFIDRTKSPVRTVADMLEVNRVLRAILFLGMLPQHEQTPWIYDTVLNDTLYKWMRIPYFDLWILCEHTLSQISRWAPDRSYFFGIIHKWIRRRTPGAEPQNGDGATSLMDRSTFLLMLQTANTRPWTVGELVGLALAFTIPALMDESVPDRLLINEFIVQFDRAFDTYYARHGGDSGDKLDDIVKTRSRFKNEPGRQRHMFLQRWEAASRHRMYLQISDVLGDYAFHDLVNLVCQLRDASDGEEVRAMDLSRMEEVLNYLGSNYALYATWTKDMVPRVVALLQMAVSNEGRASAYTTPNGPAFHWSTKLGMITRHLFVHAMRNFDETTPDTLNTLLYVIGEKFAPGTYHRYPQPYYPNRPNYVQPSDFKSSLESDPSIVLEDCMLNLLRPVSLQVLPDASPETVSPWSLALRSEIVHPDHPAIAANFAAELCHIHLEYPSVDVKPYFDQLVGDDRGAKLIMVSPSDSVKICRHAKRVSPDWWQGMDSILLDGQWNPEEWTQDEWPTAEAFVDAVNAEGPCCDACPDTEMGLLQQQGDEIRQ